MAHKIYDLPIHPTLAQELPIVGLVPGQIIQLYTSRSSRIEDMFDMSSTSNYKRGLTTAKYDIDGTDLKYIVDLSDFILINDGNVFASAQQSYSSYAGSNDRQVSRTVGSDKHTLTKEEIPPHRHRIAFGQAEWGDNANRRNFPRFGGNDGDSDYQNDYNWKGRNYTQYYGGTGTNDGYEGSQTPVDMRQSTRYVITMVYAPKTVS